MGYLAVGAIGAAVLSVLVAVTSLFFQTISERTLPVSRFGMLAFFNLFIAAFTIIGVLQGRQSSWGLDMIVAGYLIASVPLCLLWPQKRSPRSREVTTRGGTTV